MWNNVVKTSVGTSIMDFAVVADAEVSKENGIYSSKFLMIKAILMGEKINKQIFWITWSAERRENRAEFIVSEVETSERGWNADKWEVELNILSVLLILHSEMKNRSQNFCQLDNVKVYIKNQGKK